MQLSDILQLGALGAIAFMLIVKDSKRDDFIQHLFTELKKTVDANTEAIKNLETSLKGGKK